VTKDTAKAKTLFKKACDNEIASGCTDMGTLKH